MSGNKQTLIVKQTREVSATTLHTDNLHSGWSTLTGNNQTGGGTLLNCWTTKELWCYSLWYEREKLCPLSVILPSDKAAWQLRLRLLGGWPIPSACQHPLWPAGWLRCWGQTGTAHRQTFDSDLVMCTPGLRRCTEMLCSQALIYWLALARMHATGITRLFLTGERHPENWFHPHTAAHI